VSLPKLAKRRPAICCWALAFLAILACSPVFANNPHGLGASEGTQDISHALRGSIPTHSGLQLIVKADCANVRIFTDASNSVNYAVQADRRFGATESQNVFLAARNTPRGVSLIAQSPAERECLGDITLQIHVPRRYDLDVALQSGNIVAQDVDGDVAFSTGGGEIRAGSISTSDADAKTSPKAMFIARLETDGGDIYVGNIAGGLRAATAGGQISAGDVHGLASLRTGGGDIRIGHVFGAARFTSGGGDIVARKIDGGVWADTAGGRVQIGDGVRMALDPREFSAGQRDPFPTLFRYSALRAPIPATSDLSTVRDFARLFDLLVWGGIRIDPADQQKRLVSSIAPDYPEVARLAGIEGDVTLRVFIGRDGTVRGITPLSGPPILARAALRAVEQWRYASTLVDGDPVDVVTTVTLAFRLHP
jgi:TonB family protein